MNYSLADMKVRPLVAYLLLLFLLTTRSSQCARTHKGEEIHYPTQWASIGQSVVLRFNATTGVSCWYQSSSSELAEEVSSVGRLLNGYKALFVLNMTATDSQLRILRVRKEDAGIYTCIDNDGFGSRHLIPLNVSGSVYTTTSVYPGYKSTASFKETYFNEETTAGKYGADLDSDDQSRSNGVDRNGIWIAVAIFVSVVILIALVLTYRIITRACRRIRVKRVKSDVEVPMYSSPASTDFWSESLMKVTAAKTSNVMIELPVDVESRDIFLLARQPHLFSRCTELLTNFVRQNYPDVHVIVGFNWRGLLVALPVAQKLNMPFVAIRKAGKLTGETFRASYTSRKSQTVEIEVQRNACSPEQNVVIIDDEFTTGGSLAAAAELMKRLQVKLLACIVVIDNSDHQGHEDVSKDEPDVDVFSLIKLSP